MGGASHHLLRLRVPAEPHELRRLRDALRSALVLPGMPAELTERIVLAVGEAAMNIVQHGFGDGGGGFIELTLWREGRALIVELADDAPRVARESLHGRALDDVKPGGLGLHFIHEIMDSVHYLDAGAGRGNADGRARGNRLRMVKNLDGLENGQ